MPKKERDSSESSSDSSDDSRSSSPSPRSRSEKRKKDKISSHKSHHRKSRKSYKHRDDKKKKHRRSSSEREDSRSRSRSKSKDRRRNKYKERSRSRSKDRHQRNNRVERVEREKEREREEEKKKTPSPENKGPTKSEEEIQREKERKRQIRLAKLRALKYEKEDEVQGKDSPLLPPPIPEQIENLNEDMRIPDRLVDELEEDGEDDKQSKQEQMTPSLKPTAMEEEDEIDPLDAYMNEIDQVAKKQVLESWNQGMEATGLNVSEPKIDQSKVITFEDFEHLYKAPAENGMEIEKEEETHANGHSKMNGKSGIIEEEDEDERFHREFIQAMRKKKDIEKKEQAPEIKEEEKPKKKTVTNNAKGEILDDDIEHEYMAFREEPAEDLDFLTKQKKLAEKKELKNLDQDIEYEPFRKSFYIESRDIAAMSKEEVEEYRKELGDIQVRGRDCPKPIKTWYQCGLSDILLTLITEKKKFDNPFPIQCQAIPAIMSGRDVIGVAETGSGKTLAYVLPMLRHIKDQRPLAEGEGPIGLIMAPTRELAWQIYQECKTFARVIGLNVACVYGGAGVQGQIADLKRGCEIVVCTPGRMIDVLQTSNGKITNLKRVTFVVLDEADRMLDSGFQPQIERIMSNVRQDRQTAMFSATFPRNVETLAKKVLVKPVEIIVGSRGKISANVEQIIEVIQEDDKFLRLLKYLGDWSEKGSILIFVNKQTDADNLFKELLKYAYYALVLHGGQDPDDREGTISDFKKGIRTLMVATSVCARGLDIKSLVLVVNYQCPQHKEDYIHRIGRTGRAGNKGTAVTFITPEEDQYAFDIITALRMSNIEPPEDLVDLSEGYRKKVEKGEAKFYTNKNLAGSGFRFDKSEEDKVKETKRALKRQFGLELDMSDNEDDEIIVGKESKSDKDNMIDEAQIKKMLKDPNTRTAVTRAAEKAAKDAILAGSSADEVLQSAHNAIRSILGQYKGNGLETAVRLVGQIEEREDELNERVSADLEINDYPLSARNKVTHKDYLAMLHDLTNCSVSVRGVYLEPGKKNPGGLKKLRLHIVGENKYEVESAYREIRKILDEAAAQAMNTVGGQGGGKFTI